MCHGLLVRITWDGDCRAHARRACHRVNARYMCLLLLPLIVALTFEGSLRWGWMGDEPATHKDANIAPPYQFRKVKAAV